jgi:four helix bundle protein
MNCEMRIADCELEGAMTPEQMKQRTKSFALRVIKLCSSLPRNIACDSISRQLVRSGTSVAANYRAACRAKSSADFIAKMGIVEEEADECGLWFELLVDSDQMKKAMLEPLMDECHEILAITIASINTARGGKRKSAIRNSQSAIE